MLKRVWRKGRPTALLWESKSAQPLQSTVWTSLKNLKTEVAEDSTIPLLGIHAEKNLIKKDTCTSMLITVLYISQDMEVT